jgi:hypothetical protein
MFRMQERRFEMSEFDGLAQNMLLPQRGIDAFKVRRMKER